MFISRILTLKQYNAMMIRQNKELWECCHITPFDDPFGYILYNQLDTSNGKWYKTRDHAEDDRNYFNRNLKDIK